MRASGLWILDEVDERDHLQLILGTKRSFSLILLLLDCIDRACFAIFLSFFTLECRVVIPTLTYLYCFFLPIIGWFLGLPFAFFVLCTTSDLPVHERSLWSSRSISRTSPGTALIVYVSDLPPLEFTASIFDVFISLCLIYCFDRLKNLISWVL